MRRLAIAYFLGLVLLLAIPINATAAPTNYLEDFTGNTYPPTESWYTYSGAANSGTLSIATCSSGPMVGPCLQSTITGSGQTPTATFAFNAYEYTGVYQFDIRCDTAGAAGSHELYLMNSAGAIMVRQSIAGTGTQCFSNTVDGSGTTAFIPATAPGWYSHWKFTINYATDTYTREYTLNGGSVVSFGARSLLTASTAGGYLSLQSVSGSSFKQVALDNLNLGSQDITPPTTPTGLRAEVVQSFDGDNSLIDLTWPVSSNDPNQIQGSFTYQIYSNGVFISNDAVTVNDENGVRYSQMNLAGTTATTVSFTIRAQNATNGMFSDFTCSVSVNTAADNIDVCGTGTAGGAGGVIDCGRICDGAGVVSGGKPGAGTLYGAGV